MGNIWSTDPYVFKTTASGLKIFDLYSEALIQFVEYYNGFNSVWSNNQYVYLATSVSGVYRIPLSTISGTISLETYKLYPNITSNNVKYLHGNGDYICIATESGVDRYKFSTDYRDTTSVNDVTKCYQTSLGDYYYLSNPGYPIIGLDDNLFGWSYVREIEFSIPIPEDNYQMLIEIPVTQPDDIYLHSNVGGIDVRFIDDSGQVSQHHIKEWNYVDNPKFWVSISKYTEKLYILYGNIGVADTSTPEGDYAIGPPTYIVSNGVDTPILLNPPKLYAVYDNGDKYTYTSQKNGILEASYINDIYVTENTSIYEGNVIFLATSYGVIAIEEKRGDESNCRKRIYLLET